MKTQRKSFAASLLQSRIVLVLLLCISIVSLIQLGNEIARRLAFTKEIGRLQGQMLEMRQQSASLNQLIEYLGSDSYIEAEARKKLTLRKPGERVVVVGAGTTTTDRFAVEDSAANNSLAAWWDYFFSHAN